MKKEMLKFSFLSALSQHYFFRHVHAHKTKAACKSRRERIPPASKTPSPAPTEQPTPPPTQDAATQAPTERPSPAATPKVEIVSEDPVTAALYREEAAAIKSAQMLSESIAIQFYATAPFNSLQLTCPSWSNSIGTLVFDLYKWEGSFQDSFNTTLATQEFENYPVTIIIQ